MGIPEIEFLHVTHAVLLAQVQFVFTRFIGKVSDPFSIGRPRGIALLRAGGVCQVADVAMFDGDGQNFAVRLEDGARACR